MADNMEDLKKLKVPELREALKVKGLPTSGTKQELINRLVEASSGSTQSDPVIDEDEILKDEDDNVPDVAVVPVTTKLIPISAPPQSQNNNNNGIQIKSLELPTTSQNVTETNTSLAKPAEVKKLTEAERLKIRADKFGITSEQAKKEIRAQRFGSTAVIDNKFGTISMSVPAADSDKLQKRADRFGVSTSSVTEDEKKRKRAERFGTTLSTPSTSANKVTLNSTDSELEAKKRKRAERFGLT